MPLATNVLVAALGGLVKMKRDIPEPSAADAGPVVVVPMLQSARLALDQAMREEGLNNVTLARKLGLVEGEVQRMLDLDHQTGIGTLEKALWQLGRALTVSSVPATSSPDVHLIVLPLLEERIDLDETRWRVYMVKQIGHPGAVPRG